MPVESGYLWPGMRKRALRSESRDSASFVPRKMRVASAPRRQSARLCRDFSRLHAFSPSPTEIGAGRLRAYLSQALDQGCVWPARSESHASDDGHGRAYIVVGRMPLAGARQSDGTFKLERSSVRRWLRVMNGRRTASTIEAWAVPLRSRHLQKGPSRTRRDAVSEGPGGKFVCASRGRPRSAIAPGVRAAAPSGRARGRRP